MSGTDACLLFSCLLASEGSSSLGWVMEESSPPCLPHFQPGGGLGGIELLDTIPIGSLYLLQRMTSGHTEPWEQPS